MLVLVRLKPEQKGRKLLGVKRPILRRREQFEAKSGKGKIC